MGIELIAALAALAIGAATSAYTGEQQRRGMSKQRKLFDLQQRKESATLLSQRRREELENAQQEFQSDPEALLARDARLRQQGRGTGSLLSSSTGLDQRIGTQTLMGA